MLILISLNVLPFFFFSFVNVTALYPIIPYNGTDIIIAVVSNINVSLLFIIGHHWGVDIALLASPDTWVVML